MSTDPTFDPTDPAGPIAQVAYLVQEMDIPFPPIPESMAPLLQQKSRAMFTSRTRIDSLADLDDLIEEAVTGDPPPYVAFSHEGHGTNAWYLRYAVVTPQVAVFVELSFGGIYRDQDNARIEAAQALLHTKALLAETEGLQGPRYVIDHRGMEGSRWCRPDGSGEPEWHDEDSALTAVRSAVIG